MKKAWSLLLVLPLVGVAMAQDDDDDYTGYEEAIQAEPYYGAEPTPYEETVPVYDDPEEEDPGRPLYVGLDLVTSTLSSSSLPGFGIQDFDSGQYRLKFGTRIFDDHVGLEFHYGLNRGSKDQGEVDTDTYYGLFLVPTATVLDYFELALLMGYARNSVASSAASANLNGVAYGFDMQFPLRLYFPDMPDIRFGLGWMVYYQDSDARMYGANIGVRYDFTTGNLGFGRVGEWVGSLWPFGGGADD
jgi:hypothetical protein